MTIKRKFGLFSLCIVTIFMVLSLFIYKTIDDIRINGSTYNKIILGNNLIADILPPPNYIIESYLVSYELLFNISDKDKITNLVDYLEKRLIPEYLDRYAFWMQDTAYLYEGSELKTLYMESDALAQKYFKLLAEEYIPAIEQMNYPMAHKIFSEKLKPDYDEHRKAVDALVIEANKTNGSIEAAASKNLLSSIIVMAVVAVLYLVLFGVIIGVLSSSINSGLKKNVMILKNISEGDGDLTQQIRNSSKDELGEMAKYFNLTMSKIRSLVILVQQQSAILDGVGMRLSSNMTETAAAIHEISANTQRIKNQMLNQSASVTETSATMDQISKGVEKLNLLIEEQSGNVTESSSAIEEMMANIGNVTHTLVGNSENISKLSESSEAGKKVIEKVTTAIRDVAKESEGLMEISRVIQNIASQTNLLSMNAAIEAAHAGESGRGFAVVADEIRKLAESSSSQTKTIASVLKSIKDSMSIIIKYSEEVVTKFLAIEAGIRTVAEQEDGIRRAMEEQSDGSKQVLEAITMLNDITQKVQASSSEILTGSNQVSKEARNMSAITEEITNGMNEMASGAHQVNVAVIAVNELSIENKNSIGSLIDEVNKFKV